MSPFTFIQDGIENVKGRFSIIDRRINRSTFGRVFRLEGSGHVSCCHATFSVMCQFCFLGALIKAMHVCSANAILLTTYSWFLPSHPGTNMLTMPSPSRYKGLLSLEKFGPV